MVSRVIVVGIFAGVLAANTAAALAQGKISEGPPNGRPISIAQNSSCIQQCLANFQVCTRGVTFDQRGYPSTPAMQTQYDSCGVRNFNCQFACK
jgi:hypothetical protein